MNQHQIDQKREWIKDKFIVGIDPAKDKHQAFIINGSGYAVGESFSFTHNTKGFHDQFWFKTPSPLFP